MLLFWNGEWTEDGIGSQEGSSKNTISLGIFRKILFFCGTRIPLAF
jgi:hypothetical protein